MAIIPALNWSSFIVVTMSCLPFLIIILKIDCLLPVSKSYPFPFSDSKTLKEEKREELFENLKADESIGWAVDIIDPRELSAKMLKKLVNYNKL